MAATHEDGEAFERAVTPGPTRHDQYLAGQLTVDDWTDEELARGMLRARDGTWRGSPPKMVPVQLLQAQGARLRQRAQARLEAGVFDAVDHVTTVVRGDEPPNADRLRAANMVIERTLGKTVDRVDVQVTAAPAWQGIFARIAVEQPAPVVLTAEVVEP